MFKISRMLIIGMFIIVGCASINKAKLRSDNPLDAISEVQGLRESSQRNQFDLLANTQFENGERYLNEAIERFNNSNDKSSVIEKLSQSKAYFIDANKVAQSRPIVSKRILVARKATLENGVREDQRLIRRLEETDESLRDKTSQ